MNWFDNLSLIGCITFISRFHFMEAKDYIVFVICWRSPKYLIRHCLQFWYHGIFEELFNHAGNRSPHFGQSWAILYSCTSQQFTVSSADRVSWSVQSIRHHKWQGKQFPKPGISGWTSLVAISSRDALCASWRWTVFWPGVKSLMQEGIPTAPPGHCGVSQHACFRAAPEQRPWLGPRPAAVSLSSCHKQKYTFAQPHTIEHHRTHHIHMTKAALLGPFWPGIWRYPTIAFSRCPQSRAKQMGGPEWIWTGEAVAHSASLRPGAVRRVYGDKWTWWGAKQRAVPGSRNSLQRDRLERGKAHAEDTRGELDAHQD